MVNITAEQALEWIESHSSLHNTVEILYVVDGYEVTLVRDGIPIHLYHGETLLEAIRKASGNG